MYGDDNLQKLYGDGKEFPGILSQLDSADYLFVTSNRLYKSIRASLSATRWRRPTTTALFGATRLRAGSKTSHTGAFGVSVNDDAEGRSRSTTTRRCSFSRKPMRTIQRRSNNSSTARLSTPTPIVNVRPTQTGKNMLMLDEAERKVQAGRRHLERDLPSRRYLRTGIPSASGISAFQLMAFGPCRSAGVLPWFARPRLRRREEFGIARRRLYSLAPPQPAYHGVLAFGVLPGSL